MAIFLINKKEGETPLSAMDNFFVNKPEFSDVKKTYAGRLDPMAEGLLVVLTGEDCKRKEEYLNLKKVYEFSVLLGFETDTADILGLVKNVKINDFNIDSFDKETLKKEMVGKVFEEYPIYSSKTLLGKPLFLWAREGKVKEIEIPKHYIEVFDFSFLGLRKISSLQLVRVVESRILRVEGDFRQKEILEKWKSVLNTKEEKDYYIISFRAGVSSGTYIRVLSERIGVFLGIEALAYSIKRTKVGDFDLKDAN